MPESVHSMQQVAIEYVLSTGGALLHVMLLLLQLTSSPSPATAANLGVHRVSVEVATRVSGFPLTSGREFRVTGGGHVFDTANAGGSDGGDSRRCHPGIVSYSGCSLVMTRCHEERSVNRSMLSFTVHCDDGASSIIRSSVVDSCNRRFMQRKLDPRQHVPNR